MTLRRALMVLALTALAALSGCGDNGGNGSEPAPNTVHPGASLNATYVVTGITTDGTAHPLVDGTEVRIRFGDDKITLTAGCNTMSGGYTLEGSRLTVEPMAMTEMGCDQARMEQDSWLAGLFAKPVLLTTGEDAAIVAGSTVLALTDREQVYPDKPLAKTVWVLDTIGDKDTVTSIEHVVGYVVFSDDAVGLYDGCNEGSADIAINGDQITFGDRTSTLRACTGGTVEEVQKAFSDVIRGTATYTITERVLTITKGDRSLGFQAATKLPQHD